MSCSSSKDVSDTLIKSEEEDSLPPLPIFHINRREQTPEAPSQDIDITVAAGERNSNRTGTPPSMSSSDALIAMEGLKTTVARLSGALFQLQGQVDVLTSQATAQSRLVEKLCREAEKRKNSTMVIDLTTNDNQDTESTPETSSRPTGVGSIAVGTNGNECTEQQNEKDGIVGKRKRTSEDRGQSSTKPQQLATPEPILTKTSSPSSHIVYPSPSTASVTNTESLGYKKRLRSSMQLGNSVPASSNRCYDSQFETFIKVLQTLQKQSKDGTARLGPIRKPLLEADDKALTKIGVTNITDFFIKAQEVLDLILLPGAQLGTEKFQLRNPDQPWLEYRWETVPIFIEQATLLHLNDKGKKRKFSPSGKPYYPLVAALLQSDGTGWNPVSKFIKSHKEVENQALKVQKFSSLNSYLTCSTVVCNIEVWLPNDQESDGSIRLTNVHHPFKSHTQNAHFFAKEVAKKAPQREKERD